MNFNDYNSRTKSKAVEEDNDDIEDEEDHELCINATGIIVAIVLFLVLQIVIAVVWTQFLSKKKKKERDYHTTKQIFNPYAIRS